MNDFSPTTSKHEQTICPRQEKMIFSHSLTLPAGRFLSMHTWVKMEDMSSIGRFMRQVLFADAISPFSAKQDTIESRSRGVHDIFQIQSSVRGPFCFTIPERHRMSARSCRITPRNLGHQSDSLSHLPLICPIMRFTRLLGPPSLRGFRGSCQTKYIAVVSRERP